MLSQVTTCTLNVHVLLVTSVSIVTVIITRNQKGYYRSNTAAYFTIGNCLLKKLLKPLNDQ